MANDDPPPCRAHGVPFGQCGMCDGASTRSSYVAPDAPMNVWGPKPEGLTLDHFQELLDQAAIRRVRSFTLKTTMAGVAVELTAQFEPPERKKNEHE